MAKPEASLWDYLRTVLPATGHYSRIESATCPGFPDVHYTLLGYSGTIELKVGDPKFKKPFAKKGLRKSQIDWIEEEDKSNGKVWIIAQVERFIFLVDGNVYFYHFNSFDLNELKRLATFCWIRGEEEPTEELEKYLPYGMRP